MAWNQPGNPNNNPWGKKPAPGGGDFDQAFKDWQKRIESLFGGSGGGSATSLLFIGIAILAIWMATGLYQVQPGNQGVVQRFGKHVQTVGDGWGWRLPWPIETVIKVDVGRRQIHEYKSSVLTAEPNMVELQVAVQYRIKNAEDNLFKVRDPAATLSEVSESAIREVVGRNDQQAILEAGRIKIAEDTRVIMQRTLDSVRRRHRSAQREYHRRAGARGRAAGAARLGQGKGRSRTHDQGSPGLCQWHPAQGPG
jgi:membrane protease subunit HflK